MDTGYFLGSCIRELSICRLDFHLLPIFSSISCPNPLQRQGQMYQVI